jgi:hypothetical protein
LRRTDDLPANALLLTRATGIRIGSVSIWRWTACGKSALTNGRCTSPSANHSPNLWCPPMQTCDTFWPASLLYALWRRPRN